MDHSDELIRRGNLLITAAREGRIGLVEEDLRQLQKAYLASKQAPDPRTFQGLVQRFMTPYLMVMGLLAFTLGILDNAVVALVGFGLLMGAGVNFQNGKKAKEQTGRYINIVESEYPKIEKVA